MIDLKQRKSGGGKLSRSETVTVRLDPKLRYLAELAARKQRRTLSSFIEWAIEDVMNSVAIYEGNGQYNEESRSIGDEAEFLWDVDDSDRFAKLAIRYPELLTHEEQIIWKLIKENGFFWYGNWGGINKAFQWKIEEKSLIFNRLRDYWDTFKKVAIGEKPKSDLPTWNKYKSKGDEEKELKEEKNGFDAFDDDDIPF